QNQADLELCCMDATQPHPDDRLPAPNDRTTRRLTVFTKCDLVSNAVRPCAGIETSSFTGKGCAALKQEIHRLLTADRADFDGTVAATAVRCRDSLRLAAESLNRAKSTAESRGSEELVAAELRRALAELGKVVGAIYTDDILDRVFSRFCIGK